MRVLERLEGGVAPVDRAMPAVTLDGVDAGYGGVVALEEVDLALPAGELVAVVGPNGAGKSTLLKLLTGTMRPTRGGITLFGASVAAARALSWIAYMPQNEQLDWEFPISVREVVMSGRLGRLRAEGGLARFLPSRFADRAHHEAVERALAAVGLEGLAARSIGALSGGQRKRALLARALAQDARLLLLDEALAGVDRDSEQVVHRVLLEARDQGRTLLLVTHDHAGAARLADRVVLLNRRLLAVGPPASVLGHGLPGPGGAALFRPAAASPA
jgi:manganese/iron transport system ATP-binding protein